MQETKATIRNVDGSMMMSAAIPNTLTVAVIKQEAQEKLGLSMVPCYLILEKNNAVLKDDDTLVTANILDEDVLVVPDMENIKIMLC